MNVCDGASALAAAGLSLRELKDAMRAEETARLSKATQREYAVAESRDDSSWLAVTDALQRKILRQVGDAADLDPSGRLDFETRDHRARVN